MAGTKSKKTPEQIKAEIAEKILGKLALGKPLKASQLGAAKASKLYLDEVLGTLLNERKIFRCEQIVKGKPTDFFLNRPPVGADFLDAKLITKLKKQAKEWRDIRHTQVIADAIEIFLAPPSPKPVAPPPPPLPSIPLGDSILQAIQALGPEAAVSHAPSIGAVYEFVLQTAGEVGVPDFQKAIEQLRREHKIIVQAGPARAAMCESDRKVTFEYAPSQWIHTLRLF